MAMSDQHAAAALIAAAFLTAILVARAAVLRQDGGGRGARVARPVRGRTTLRAEEATPSAAALSSDAASSAVREAEQHVHHLWEQLQSSVEPPE
jgi:hypothetical protein